MIIDLRTYGLGWEIDTKTALFIPENLDDTMISNIEITSSPSEWVGNDEYSKALLMPLEGGDVEFDILERIGEGSYGKTYQTDMKEGVVKILDRRHTPLLSAIREFLIQLIIAEDTKDIKDRGIEGPFVPRVFHFALSFDNIYIFMEAMDETVRSYIGLESPPAPNIMIDIILQLAIILSHLHRLDHFNHRDLKSNNIMIKNGMMRLIDFGFSCLGKDHLKIDATNGKRFRICEKKDRDMSSFFYNMLLYNYKNPKNPLGIVMRRLLGETPNEWAGQYKYYNRSSINELMEPKMIIQLFSNLKVENPEDPNSSINMDCINLPFYAGGNTILHNAAALNNVNLVKRLFQIPELKTKSLNDAGLTAYHVAAIEANKWWKSPQDNKIFDLLRWHNPSLANAKTSDGKTADELTTNVHLKRYLISKKPLFPALTRNTDKKLWGRGRRTMRKKYNI